MPSDRLPGLPAAACEPPAGEEAPFLRHHRVARALVDTFQEALQPQLSTRGVLTREEFDRAVALMTAQWPRTLPLFARACQGCGLAGGMAEAGRDEEARPDAFRPDGRRRDFVTRLVFSSVLLKLPESVDPVSGAVFPKLLAPGLQATLSGLFFEKEWEAMNGDAIALYTQIGSDRDAVVWQRIARQQALAVLADAMFVRVMLRFRQFHLQRQTVVRRMIDRLRERRFVFTDEHFDLLFETMFGRLRGALGSELDRARIDVRYGEGTAEALMRIFDQFDRHRLEQSLPVQSIGGARRPGRSMLAQRCMLGAAPAGKR